jgi:hypothetical protein
MLDYFKRKTTATLFPPTRIALSMIPENTDKRKVFPVGIMTKLQLFPAMCRFVQFDTYSKKQLR